MFGSVLVHSATNFGHKLYKTAEDNVNVWHHILKYHSYPNSIDIKGGRFIAVVGAFFTILCGPERRIATHQSTAPQFVPNSFSGCINTPTQLPVNHMSDMKTYQSPCMVHSVTFGG